ncbi:MAG: RecQ family ATP-dependent DNA helicase [Clostridia bacterium]|nr:RecQ family ATP-dependent DNA helicase [Clostridia bacterium]
MDKYEVLRHYFGHEGFRAGQETMVDALLAGRDALGVMPTGAGKSMCYQVPALMLPGITLVISPLISLMADQVAALKSAGVPAAYLNSTLTPRQMELALERAYQGAYKIIYVAPERLETPSFLRFAQSVQIALVAVDEAHCVSQWGQDFRPVYLRIADFVDMLPRRPVMGAFTATATERVRQDIIHHLRLRDPAGVTTGFDRPNLYFEVVRLKSRDPALMQILAGKRGQSGIVYCATRKAVEAVCDKLCAAGYAAGRYHAGLSDEERRQNQEDFQYDRVQIMVATNAFGMGIDKSNVRFVIHYNMPKSMEAYYQEAGRAGRDGEPSECILLYNAQDIITARWLINNSPPNEALSAAEQANVRRLDLQRLQSMIDYCTKDQCLRGYVLRYFGEKAVEDRCGDCGFCTGGRYGEAMAARPAPTRRPAAEKPVPVGRIEGAGDLFEMLRAVRMELAKKHHVPPYVICSDATLNSMCRVKPKTKEGMLSVSGMGEVKTARYGEAFLKVLWEHDAASRKTRAQASELARQAQSLRLRPSAVPKQTGKAPRPAAPAPKPAAPRAAMPLPPARPPLEDDDEALADAYLSGVTIEEMADELGLHPGEIRQRLRDMDLIF